MFTLALFAIPICISDWQYRRIPNIYLVFITYELLATRAINGFESLPVLLLSICIAIIAFLIGVGAGDAKLFIVIAGALNMDSFGALLILVSSIYITSIAQVVLNWLYLREIPRSIPLAFSIILGSTLYLAASTSLSLRQYADALVNSW